jgi:hypothetical protein
MKLLRLLCIYLMVVSSFGQSTPHYQVAVIVGVKPHQTAADKDSSPTKYDVSLKIGDTIYVVLYTPPLGVGTVKYAEGRNLLVAVGEKTISYNDLLGQSFEVPIISRKPAPDSAQPK